MARGNPAEEAKMKMMKILNKTWKERENEEN
jgi:hypothetical protein